jgi:hypothetical protein
MLEVHSIGGAMAQKTTVPVGLEKILYLAAVDAEFRAALLEDREAALQARGLELRPSELSMLRLAPREQLEASIAGLDTSPGSLERRGFMRAVAATAATVVASSALGGCETVEKTAGIRPSDVRVERPSDYTAIRGIEPDGKTDAKTDVQISVDAPMPAGIRPDDGGKE